MIPWRAYALLGLLVLAGGAVVGVWAWYEHQLSKAYDRGHAVAVADCTRQKEASRREAEQRAAKNQTESERLGKLRDAEHQQKLEEAARLARLALSTYRESVHAQPTANNACRVPADRVRFIDAAMGNVPSPAAR